MVANKKHCTKFTKMSREKGLLYNVKIQTYFDNLFLIYLKYFQDTEVILSNFYADEEKFPAYLPEVQFEIELSIKHKQVYGYRTFINGAIIHKGKKKLG